MTYTPLGISALVAAAALLIATQFAPTPRPVMIGKLINTTSGIATLFLTFLHVTAYPAALPLPTWGLGLILVGLALASPLLGLLENVVRAPAVAYSGGRTWAHAGTNVLGAAVATASIALARGVSGSDGQPATFTNDEILNIFLLISTLVVTYFVFGQQAEKEDPQEPSRSASTAVGSHRADSQAGPQYENSLSRWHQIANVLHLVVATFVAVTSFIFVLAISMLRAKEGTPLEFTWEAALMLASALLFVLACGLPRARDDRSVFMTFLTGTPAILCTAILWMSFFKESIFRNAFALSATTIGYVIYVGLTVSDSKRRDGNRNQPTLQYYTALLFALMLALLLAGLYLS